MSLGGTAVEPGKRDHSQTAKSNRSQVSQTWTVGELAPLNRALKLKCRKLKLRTDVLLERVVSEFKCSDVLRSLIQRVVYLMLTSQIQTAAGSTFSVLCTF